MEIEKFYQELRKKILLDSPMKDKAIEDLSRIFNYRVLEEREFLAVSGNYPTHFAFVLKGFLYSFYSNPDGTEDCRTFYKDLMFVLPLPAFINRMPAYLNFRAIVKTELLQAKYYDLEQLMMKDDSTNKFVRKLIDQEWIINRELHESSEHIYNSETRFRLFSENFGKYIYLADPKHIASYLKIPEKQVIKYRETQNRSEQMS